MARGEVSDVDMGVVEEQQKRRIGSEEHVVRMHGRFSGFEAVQDVGDVLHHTPQHQPAATVRLAAAVAACIRGEKRLEEKGRDNKSDCTW